MKVNTEGLVAVAEGGTAASGDAAAAGPSSAAGGESGAAVAGEAGAAAVPQTRTPTMADAAACFESTRHRLHGEGQWCLPGGEVGDASRLVPWGVVRGAGKQGGRHTPVPMQALLLREAKPSPRRCTPALPVTPVHLCLT